VVSFNELDVKSSTFFRLLLAQLLTEPAEETGMGKICCSRWIEVGARKKIIATSFLIKAYQTRKFGAKKKGTPTSCPKFLANSSIHKMCVHKGWNGNKANFHPNDCDAGDFIKTASSTARHVRPASNNTPALDKRALRILFYSHFHAVAVGGRCMGFFFYVSVLTFEVVRGPNSPNFG
jgi:hypothetical protein